MKPKYKRGYTKMKPKYKLGAWVMSPAYFAIHPIRGIHISIYDKNSENLSYVEYELEGIEEFVNENDIECEMVPKK